MSPYDHFVGEQPSTRTIDQAITNYSVEPDTLIGYSDDLRASLSHLTELTLHTDESGTHIDDLQTLIAEVTRQITEDAAVFTRAVRNFSIRDDTTGAEMTVPPSFGDVYLLAGAVDATKDAGLSESLGKILHDMPPAYSDMLEVAYLRSRTTGENILTEHRKLDVIEADLIEAYEAGAPKRAAEAQALKEKEQQARWAATLLARKVLKQASGTAS